MARIDPFLWFDKEAEEAARFYVAIFPNSKVGQISRYGDAGPGPKGSVMVVEFELDGQRFMGLNGGPQFPFTEAVSFMVHCKNQAEVDHYWSKLVEGGKEIQCGWLKDRFGLRWQIVPDAFGRLMRECDAAGRERVMQAMLQMVKFDIARLEAAAAG